MMMDEVAKCYFCPGFQKNQLLTDEASVKQYECFIWKAVLNLVVL